MKELIINAVELCYDWGHIPEEKYFVDFLGSPLKQKYNIDVNKIGTFLGKGSFGSAFKYGANQVLKMTTDFSEITTSALLVGKNTKYICRIDRVLAWPKELVIKNKIKIVFNNLWNKKKYPMGWILMEYLPGENKKHRKEINLLLADANFYRKKVRGGTMSKEEFSEKIHKQGGIVGLKTQDIESIIGMILEPIEYGIDFYDYNPGNIKRNAAGELKIFDLGISKSPQGKPPEEIKLEHILKMLKK